MQIFSRRLLQALALTAGWFMAASSPVSAQPPNVVPVTVRKPHAGFNRLLVSVTVCVPHTNDCAKINDVMVDTGSTGLRLETRAVPRSLRLPPLVDAQKRPLAECVRFAHDNAWGPLFKADLRIGGMVASDLPIQILDAGAQTAPDGCRSSGIPPTSNGTLGIGPWLVDCQGVCMQSTSSPGYFMCEAASCAPIRGTVDRAYRLANPVASFAVHDNGFVLDLPAAPEGGADAVEGTLTFGVGTGADNKLGQARVLRLERYGHFTTVYDGRAYPGSYIDSGTPTYVLPDDRLMRCRNATWAFCVTPERTLAARMIGRDGASFEAPFRVGNYPTVDPRHPGVSDGAAMDAPRNGDVFVWGAPFFFGKRIFVVLEGRSVPGAPGIIGPLYGIPYPPGSPRSN